MEFEMKALSLSLVLAASAALSSCVSGGGLDERYGHTAASGRTASSFSYTGGAPAAKPQHAGWYRSRATADAERKSLARDIPHAVVDPSGTVLPR